MNAWTNWEIVSHRVGICGRVVDMGGKPMPGTQIDVSAESKQSQAQPRKRSDTPAGRTQTRQLTIDAPDGSSNESEQAESRIDGIFFLLDCPDGQYTVRATDASSGTKAEKSITVADSAPRKRMNDRAPAAGCWVELVLKQ